ncbi:MAG TPA: o-succinylbenzoate synthase [Ignavibacteriaceae bacterium]|nr:o-succinylbenzoate synthase [Ignavibacteriaceae bacterium]
MNVIELIYAPYFLQLKKPFLTSAGIINKRKGFILNLKNANGLIGVGDAAPFPEFGSESIEQAEEALKNLKLQLKIDFNKIEKSISENLLQFEKLPALRHGFEQALLNLISKEKNLSLAALLRRKTKNEININGLIDIQTKEESVKSALKLRDEGYTTIKMKIGRDDFNEEYEIIKAVRDSLGSYIKIRLDVNGKWELGEAKEKLEKLKNLNIEYIEQPVPAWLSQDEPVPAWSSKGKPVNRINDFIELKKSAGIPLAADESIRTESDAVNFISERAADFLILKPMMLGGLIPALKIIDAAEANSIKTVVTSSFESAIGKASAVFTASVVNHEIAHGLNTGVCFEKDLIPDPDPVRNGKIILNKDLK